MSTPAPGSQTDLFSQMPVELQAVVKKHNEEFKKSAGESGMRSMTITMCLHEFTRGVAFAASFFKEHPLPNATVKDLKNDDEFKFNNITYVVTRKFYSDDRPLIAYNKESVFKRKEKFHNEGLEVFKLLK